MPAFGVLQIRFSIWAATRRSNSLTAMVRFIVEFCPNGKYFIIGSRISEIIMRIGFVRFMVSGMWTRIFIVSGALFDVVSTFLPWSVTADAYLYLPWSPLLAWGWVARALPFTVDFLMVSVVVRVAAAVGWAGVIFHEYVGRRFIWTSAVFVSGLLSFVAVVFFALTGFPFLFGAFLILAGGILKFVGIVVERLVEMCVGAKIS